MTKYRICVYSICKNRAQYADRFMDFAKEADLTVVADMNSEDRTAELLKAKGALVRTVEPKDFRYDYAVNQCLKFIPPDIDICVYAELDEVISPGWREKVEQAWNKDATRGLYRYNLVNDQGDVVAGHINHRIHSRKDYSWINPTFPMLQYSGKKPELGVFAEGVEFTRNIREADETANILNSYLERENIESPRNLFYLGRDYMYVGNPGRALEVFKKYLRSANSFWEEERSAAMRYISRIYKDKGDYQEAKKWLFRAMGECPNVREPYVEMALLSCMQEDFETMYYFSENALSIKTRSLGYINEKFAWDETLYDLAALSSYYLGMRNKAIKLSEMAIALAPDDQRLIENHQMYCSNIRRDLTVPEQED